MAMSEAAKEARRRIHREWQRANRDKTRLYTERHYEKKAREMGLVSDDEETKVTGNSEGRK